jgi:hypothetical protein
MARKTGDQLFDVRIVERNIRAGLVGRKDYEKFIATLDDSSQQSVDSDTRMTFDVARRRGDDIRTISDESSEED